MGTDWAADIKGEHNYLGDRTLPELLWLIASSFPHSIEHVEECHKKGQRARSRNNKKEEPRSGQLRMAKEGLRRQNSTKQAENFGIPGAGSLGLVLQLPFAPWPVSLSSGQSRSYDAEAAMRHSNMF